MKKKYYVYHDTAEQYITVGQAIIHLMGKQRISNKEMNYRMASLGYQPDSDNFISNLRRDHSKVPLEKAPLIFNALGLSEAESAYWTHQVLVAYLPHLKSHLADPLTLSKHKALLAAA